MKKWICALLVMAVCVSIFCGCEEQEQVAGTQDTYREGPTEQTGATVIDPKETEPTVDAEYEYIEVFTAKNDGTEEKYGFSELDVYMVDISSDNALECDGWSVRLAVGSGFDMKELKYVGCCDSYLDPIDIEISCELKGQRLTFESASNFEATEAGEKAYLVLVCDKLSSGQVLFYPNKQSEAAEAELRNLKRMTGEIVFDKRVTGYSEGVCWCDLKYKDTGVTVSAVVDTDGNIVSSLYGSGYESFGEFQNGVSLVRSGDDVYYYIDKQGNIVYSTDDAQYGSYIQGVFDGGYMFLLKNEADMTSNVTYYAIMDCYGDFVVDWTDYYKGHRLFDHMGGGTFSFLDSYRDSDRNNVSASFLSAQTGEWIVIGQYGTEWEGVLAPTIRNQTDSIAKDCDGWIMVESDSDLIAINVHDGEAIRVESKWTYNMSGEYGDGGYVLVKTGYSDQVEKLAFFDTATKDIIPIEYEYIDLVQKPESERLDVRSDTALELGAWPAYNMPGSLASSLMENDSFYVHRSHLHELRFSKGAMMLQLKGKDGLDYYTLIDIEGNDIIEPTLGEAIKTLGSGRFLVKCDGEYQILDEKGAKMEIVLGGAAVELFNADEYTDGVCWIETSKGVLCIDEDGNCIFGEMDFGDRTENVIVSALSVTQETMKVEKAPEAEGDLCHTAIESFEYRYGTVRQKDEKWAACVIITKYVGQEKRVVIPAEIDGMPVLSIGDLAFKESKIEELYFEGAIAEIRGLAFADCTALKNVELPDNWMVLGGGCFSGCDSLRELEVPADAQISDMAEVWNEELGIYEYVGGSPVDEEDSTVIVYRNP